MDVPGPGAQPGKSIAAKDVSQQADSEQGLRVLFEKHKSDGVGAISSAVRSAVASLAPGGIWRVANALLEMGGFGVSVLLQLARGDRRDIPDIVALGRVAADPAVEARMMAFVASGPPDVVAAAMESLGGARGDASLETLRQGLRSRHPNVRSAAVDSLRVRADGASKRAVSRLTHDISPMVRIAALSYLASQPDEATAGSLWAAIHDPYQEVASIALDLLFKLIREEGRRAAETALRSNPDAGLAWSAERILLFDGDLDKMMQASTGGTYAPPGTAKRRAIDEEKARRTGG